MQDLSFTWPHPRFPTPAGDLTLRIHTGGNVYGLDPERCNVIESEGVVRIECTGLTWAGGQQRAAGAATVLIRRTDNRVVVSVTGSHPDGVRCLALTVHDLVTGPVTGVREGALPVPSAGRIVTYPNGWFDLATPLVAIDHGNGQLTSARSLDSTVRAKRFVVVPDFADPAQCSLELIVDAEATTPASELDASWEIEATTELTSVQSRHAEHVRTAYAVPSWRERTDVPDWMREKSLVVTLHGMHFTGRVFLDYAAMLDSLRRITEQIDGNRVLAYLPGWEGRYYRWYGRYGTDERLGGDAGFHRLIDGARELGVQVMPMFGANVVARDLPGFEVWAAPGQLMHASGGIPVGSVDWDGSRHYDHSWASLVNPAYKPWRDRLAEQILSLQRTFHFDAAFLDISAMYSNDPRGDTTEGLRKLVETLHAGAPDLLIAGEAWFDALGGLTPLVQTGHRDGVPVHHDLPHEDLFTTSNRSFGHICLGEPAHYSTGCHEAGYNPHWRLPVREGVIPTLGVVEDTLTAAPERVAEILADARSYAAKFLL